MNKKKYTEQDIKVALELYQLGRPVKEIADQIGVCVGTIYNMFKRNDIKTDRWEYTPNYNEETRKEFERTFFNQYIPFVPTDDYHYCKMDKYFVNYFDNIDHQDKAYILGFLYADGNMAQNKCRTSIALQERDKCILEKINKAIGNKKELCFVPSSNPNWQNSYILRIDSKRMCDALLYHGIFPKKSLLLEFPLNFPFMYYKDFIRGYIDGDGYIGNPNSKGGHNNERVQIISTRNFCESLKLLIENYLNINCSISKASCKNNVTSQLSIGGRQQCIKFLDWIYEDANLYLERKYQKYLDIKKSVA